MKLHKDLDWVLYSAQIRIHDMDPSDTSRKDAQDVLDAVRDALSDIQTDNDGQFIIYTGIKDPEWINEEEDQAGSHVFKGSSVVDDCSLCGRRYVDEIHC